MLRTSLDVDALRHIASSPHLAELEQLTGFYGIGAEGRSTEARSIVQASPHLRDDLSTNF